MNLITGERDYWDDYKEWLKRLKDGISQLRKEQEDEK